MVALGAGQAGLGLFEATELLDAPMVGFDLPGKFGKTQAREFVHVQVVGGPVFNVAVCGNELEDTDQPIALQMDRGALRAERDGGQWTGALSRQID